MCYAFSPLIWEQAVRWEGHPLPTLDTPLSVYLLASQREAQACPCASWRHPPPLQVILFLCKETTRFVVTNVCAIVPYLLPRSYLDLKKINSTDSTHCTMCCTCATRRTHIAICAISVETSGFLAPQRAMRAVSSIQASAS